MAILHHWLLMAVTAVALMGLLITLRDQGWQTFHWAFFVLVPIWIGLIRQLYTQNWDTEEER